MSVNLPDFEVLVALHRQDPEALEAFRRHVLREAVDDAPLAHRPALEQLLLHIETVRNTASTPIEAASTAFNMMQESVMRLHDGWEQARYAMAELQAALLIERMRSGPAPEVRST